MAAAAQTGFCSPVHARATEVTQKAGTWVWSHLTDAEVQAAVASKDHATLGDLKWGAGKRLVSRLHIISAMGGKFEAVAALFEAGVAEANAEVVATLASDDERQVPVEEQAARCVPRFGLGLRAFSSFLRAGSMPVRRLPRARRTARTS